ncbi:MAG: hypothetical protein K2O54_04320, partial [Prevotella sp.]|nr:hypothetical protein [Prevotella sp.]
FYRWQDESIRVVDVPTNDSMPCSDSFLPTIIATSFRVNGPTTSKYVDLMQRFVRNEKLTIYDIPLDLNEELLRLDANSEVFLFTPLLLYIIQTVTSEFLSENTGALPLEEESITDYEI